MNKQLRVLGACTLLAAWGCGGEMTEGDLDTVMQGVNCNDTLVGVYPALRRIAVAMASDMGRWEATTYLGYANGKMVITPAGLARCVEHTGLTGCNEVRNALYPQDLQNPIEVNGQRIFDPEQFRQQLRVYYERQLIMEQRQCGGGDAAWCADHEISRVAYEQGECAADITYAIDVDESSCSGAECSASKIVTKLKFAGWPENTYLRPRVRLDVSPPTVTID